MTRNPEINNTWHKSVLIVRFTSLAFQHVKFVNLLTDCGIVSTDMCALRAKSKMAGDGEGRPL